MARARSWCRRLAVAALVAAISGQAAQARADEAGDERAFYELGRGLPLFGGRLIVGGYASVEAEFLDQAPDRLGIDDLSTFLTLNLTDRWLVFTEIELEDPVHVDSGGVGSGDPVFSLERLYTEWNGGDRFRVRGGQMLTPIGIWNVIHAAPLVWSTSRPIATEQFFDTGLTGVEATLFVPVSGAELALSALGQATNQIDDTNDPQETRRGFGARAELATANGPRVGASFLRFKDREDRRTETAAGVDLLWNTRHVELWSEIAANVPDSGSTTWGGYVQAVWHAPRRLHPFVRLEYADLGSFERVPIVFGVAWKPLDPVIVKLEGVVGGDDTTLEGDGFLTSVAVLF